MPDSDPPTTPGWPAGWDPDALHPDAFGPEAQRRNGRDLSSGLTDEEMWRQVHEEVGKRRPIGAEESIFPPLEDRGYAVRSPQAEVHYVYDVVRPRRITLVPAEEGTGKSYFVSGELCIRVACADRLDDNLVAGVWPVGQRTNVMVLSEMDSDDDYDREEMVLASLGLTRPDLSRRYFRQHMLVAANGEPPLMDTLWRGWVIEQMRDLGIGILVLDTGTQATRVDPWGNHIQEVFGALRVMQSTLPDLAIVILVHLNKPKGIRSNDRGLSAVQGEWGRWCDIVLMMEDEGPDHHRVRLSLRKRVRAQRRVVATKDGGLLVDPQDIDAAPGTKVDLTIVVMEVRKHMPAGVTYADLATLLGVTKPTAITYVSQLSADLVVDQTTKPYRVRTRVVATGSFDSLKRVVEEAEPLTPGMGL